MPISSHCFWPCDSRPAWRSASVSRRIRRSVSAMRSRLRRVRAGEQAAPDALVGLHRQFEVLEHRVVLEDRRLLELAADAGVRDLGLGHARQVDGLAEEARCRESGRVLPVMTSIIVVLPAPLGPMMQRSSPASIVSDSLFSALKPSKLTVMSSRYRMTGAVGRVQPSRMLPERSIAQRSGVHAALRRVHRARLRFHRPTTPSGSHSVTPTNMAPRKNSQYSGKRR
jgi:hypothetical protein